MGIRQKDNYNTLKKYGVTQSNGLVCLAGFMRIISPEFVKKYKNRIINIHPALLPAFPGLGLTKTALEYGQSFQDVQFILWMQEWIQDQ